MYHSNPLYPALGLLHLPTAQACHIPDSSTDRRDQFPCEEFSTLCGDNERGEAVKWRDIGDVNLLFTNVLVDEALEIVHRGLNHDDTLMEQTNLTSAKVTNLLQLFL